MAEITLKGLGKVYPDGTRAVGDVDLDIQDAEFLVLVGPSGCGKSTILRMIAGLEEITEGDMFIGETLVNDVQPKDRDIAMVFQNYALYPHMTVYDNMAFGLKLRKMPKEDIDRRVKEAAATLEITEFLEPVDPDRPFTLEPPPPRESIPLRFPVRREPATCRFC